MPVDKILGKIRSRIIEATPHMELFADEKVQPGVADCEKLQQGLHLLLEQLAVYKYSKQNYELSPSYNLHAHISETTSDENARKAADTKPISAPETTAAAPQQEQAPAKKAPEQRNGNNGNKGGLRQLHIGINDKFRFINELFAKNNAEYNIALEQLSNLQNWSETEIYLNSLKSLYGWRENHDAVKHFFSLVKKRFQ